MKEPNASVSLKDSFPSYHTIISVNGGKFIITGNQRVSVKHVLYTVRQTSLLHHPTSDLSFAKHEHRKEFAGFLRLTICFTEALTIVYCGLPPKIRQNSASKGSGNQNGGTSTIPSLKLWSRIWTPNYFCVCRNQILRKDWGNFSKIAGIYRPRIKTPLRNTRGRICKEMSPENPRSVIIL